MTPDPPTAYQRPVQTPPSPASIRLRPPSAHRRGVLHRFLPLLAAAATLLPWCGGITPADAQSYSQLVVFGDSLSDTGNHAERSVDDYGLRFPTYFFNYTDNRYTSGGDTRPASRTFRGVWVEQLAQRFLDLPRPEPSEEGGLDFAYGSGRTSDGTHPDVVPQLSPLVNSTYALTIDDMGLQVTNFLAGGQVDANALYCLWGGNNDLTNNPSPQGVQAAVTNEVGLIQRLALAGARNFVVVNVPPLGSTPTVLASVGPERAAGLNQLAAGFRGALPGAINQLAAGLARLGINIDVRVVDSYGLLVDAIQDPGAYGFATVTDIGQNSANPRKDDADRYLFWDGFHPTAHGHYQVAAEAFAQVSGQSVVQVGAAATTLNRSSGEIGEFILIRTGENLGRDLTVNFSLDGNARSDTDFVGVGSSVTFPAGSRRVAVPIEPTRSGGKSRTVTLTVEDGDGYRSGELRAASIRLTN